MNKGGYAAVGLGFILAGLKSGMFSGSMTKDKHSGRVRINFNINKSKFEVENDNFADRYYQYSVYGNPYALDHSSILQQMQETKGNVLISEFEYGKRTNFSEASFLKDVTFWCDVSRMQKFHEVQDEGMRLAKASGFSYGKDKKAYFKYIEDYLEGKHSFQLSEKGKPQPPVIKTPFCFLEGELLSYDEFIKDMKEAGFDINKPAGLAKFNPRDPKSQPPGFMFQEVADVGDSGFPPNSELPFLVGAKYAALINTVATPFSPVYLWGPCVCDQSLVWDHNTKKIRSRFAGFKTKEKGTNLFLNTYDLYFNRLKKCTKEVNRYGYIETLKELPEQYRIKESAMDEFIVADQYPMDIKGSMGKKPNKRKKNVRRKPVKNKPKSPNQVPESVIREQIAKRTMDIFNKNYVVKGEDHAGTCVNLALCGMLAGREFGRNFSIVGGSSQWKFIPDHLDDGISPNYFGYVYEPNSPNSRINVALGGIPELHAWLVDTERQELIDFSSYQFPAQCKRMLGEEWRSPLPPKYYWVSAEEMRMDQIRQRCFYEPSADATNRYVIPALIRGGDLIVVGNQLMPGPKLVL